MEASQNDNTATPLQRLEELITQQTHLEDALTNVQNDLTGIQTEIGKLLPQLNALNSDLTQKRQQLQKLLLAEQEAQIQMVQHQQELEQNHAQIEQLQQEISHAPSEESLSRKIRQLSSSIEALGAVNLVALEELEQAKQRSDYFSAQKLDLQTAMDALLKAINQIDQESKTLFQKTFETVNQYIQEYFPTLFGGGRAYLELVGSDLLESGVTIMANPPGKKNSSIHLLSGGEKALTAMSLIFSLFSLNPAPFCLLDEVDAPLDDANTERFCQLVRKMSQKTQFLYISHNRLTMEMADQLVGVTMQEKGVSRIVSVDIQQALSMTENAVL